MDEPMETGLDKAKLLHYKAVALKHLGDSTKLRLMVVFSLVCLIVLGAYMPLSGEIARSKALLYDRKRRLETVGEVCALRSEVASYRQRIAADADTNEWVQYVLAGLRTGGVKLRDMSSKPAEKVGPYRTVTLCFEVEGTYPEMKAFMEWLERSERLLRVDSVRLDRQPENLTMRITLLGLVRKNAKPA